MFLPLHDNAPLRVIRFQTVTAALVVINVAVFLVLRYGMPPETAQAAALALGTVPAVITARAELASGLQLVPEVATLFTYMFLHAGWLHLIGNMAFLWVFADNVEDGFGHLGFIVFFLACGVGAGLTHAFMLPDSRLPLVGASGAVAGVLASYMLLFPRSRVWVLLFMRIPVRLSALWALAGWIGFQVLAAFAGGEATAGGVAWWAHIGGFCTGLVITLMMRRRLIRRLSGRAGFLR
jgi:membrane associated rhomboid family serine protease